MILQTQIVDAGIRVSCPTDAFAAAFGHHVNTAEHQLPQTTAIEVDVRHDGHAYVLPSGRREISSEIAAYALWCDLEKWLQERLSSWLHVWGLCIDSGGRRSLILGEDWSVLRALSVYALADGITVSSANGVCIRGGVVVPYALPFRITANDQSRFEAITGCKVQGRPWRDERGRVLTTLTPQDFGLPWQAVVRPVDELLVLQWNVGGWSGIGARQHPSEALKRLALATLLPPNLTAPSKLALISALSPLAAAAPMRRLHLGHFGSFARLLREYASSHAGA